MLFHIDLFVTVYTFSFDCEPFVNIRIHIDYVCVFAAFFLLSLLFLFAVLFYWNTVLGYVWLCNFPCLHLTFSVLLHAFWWWMLFNCFVLCLLHLLLPLPPCFVFCLFFSRRHFMLFSPLYATTIARVIIVFIIVVFGQVRIIFKCL